MPVEIACFSGLSAETALTTGADRIELCGGPISSGGLTPSVSTFCNILAVRQSSEYPAVPIYIMLRPRAGDFIYSDAEFEEMRASMHAFLDAGADGFVFGILKSAPFLSRTSPTTDVPREELTIDEKRNSALIATAHLRASEMGKTIACTFHRAFDSLSDKTSGLETLVRCGFSTVLTSGCIAGGVMAGKPVLKDLVEQANGRISVMPGGGLRSGNLVDLMDQLYPGTEARRESWWHSSAIMQESGGDADGQEIKRLRELTR